MKIKYKILFIVPVLFLLDQITKLLVVKNMTFGQRIEIIPNIFDLVYFTNKGGAFGIFANLQGGLRDLFFYGVATAAVVLIILYYVSLKEEGNYIYLYLALILSGAFGNLFDRFTRGSVVDFLSFHWYDKVADWTLFGYDLSFRLEWPAFNVADSAISVGVAGIAVLTLWESFAKPCDPSS